MTKSDEQLVVDWISLQSVDRRSEKYGELIKSTLPLQRLIKSDAARSYSIIVEISNRTGDEFILSNLAAGPLEDLLVDHGDAYVRKVLQDAAINNSLAIALRMVWHERLSTETSKILRDNGYRPEMEEP